jgi:hypothetical protein
VSTELAIHAGLFCLLSLAIVVMGAFYSERDDRRALASVPRRYAVFLASCAGVALVMLALEHLFASVS